MAVRRWASSIPNLILTVGLGYFVVWPLVAIIGRGLLPHSHLRLAAVTDVFTDARVRSVFGFTLWQSLLSTVVAVALGLPIAYGLERVRPRGAGVVRVLLTIPFALPTVVVGAAFIAEFGAGGPLRSWQWLHTTTIIVVAHVYFNLGVVVRVVGTRWREFDEQLIDAARMLGANRVRTFASVTWPAIAGSVVNAAAIVWLFCLTSFGVITTLGGLTKTTIETEIFRLTTQELALDRAAALVVVQLLTVGIVAVVCARFVGSRAVAGEHAARSLVASRRSRRAWSVSLWSLAAVMVLPMLIVVQRAFETGGGGFAALRDSSRFGWRPIDSVATSLQSAAWATLFSLAMGTMAAFIVGRRAPGWRALNALTTLPIAVSAVTLGFGFLIALDRPFDLRDRWFLVPLAQAFVAAPIVLRLLVPTMQSIAPQLREVAALLGASPVRVTTSIDIAILLPALATAAAFAMAISLGEFGATSFIARQNQPTMPLAIARLLGRPGIGSQHAAFALSFVMIAIIGALAIFAGTVQSAASRRRGMFR